MDDCLVPFLGDYISPVYPELKNKKSTIKIFINPHSSHYLKNIPQETILKIIEEIFRLNDSAVIYVSIGHGEKDSKWISDFILGINSKPDNYLNRINFVKDDGLADLSKKLIEKKISSALTSDTAVCHLISRLNIPNLTIFNSDFWDEKSEQSLSAESVLGFCRFKLPQYPSLVNKNSNLAPMIKSIARAVLFLAEDHNLKASMASNPEGISQFNEKLAKLIKNNKLFSRKMHLNLYSNYMKLKNSCKNDDLSWMFEIYDPNEAVRGIIKHPLKKSGNLIRSAWMILPVYKYFICKYNSSSEDKFKKY
jgi:hypothetical protein